MAEEIKTILSIDVGNTPKNIKELKQQIKDLQDALVRTDDTTDEYKTTLNTLVASQQKLQSILKATKSEVSAAEGSYNALNATMKSLQQQWKATGDEAERNKLGKAILDINNQLKDLDSSIGNNQRKVGSYTEGAIDAFAKLRGEIKQYKSELLTLEEGTDAYNEKLAQLGEAQFAMKDMTEQAKYAVSDIGETLGAVNKVAQGVVGGFNAIQGIMALTGTESEALQKTMVKLQAGMSIVQGLQGMEGMVDSLKGLNIVFGKGVKSIGAFIKGLSGVKAAIAATGVGLFVVVLTTLIANWEKITKYFKDITAQSRAAKATRELNAEITKLANQTAAGKIVRIKELANAYSKLGDNLNAKKKFVSEYKDELADMGIEMNNVNDAEKIFKDDTLPYINAIMARVKADAARNKATKDYEKALNEIADLEKNVAEQQVALQNARNTQRDTYEVPVWLAGFAESAAIQRGEAAVNTSVQNAEKKLTIAEKRVADARAAAESELQKLLEFAKKQDEVANSVLGTGKKSKSSGGGKTPFEEALEWIKSELKAQEEVLLSEEELLDKKYRELLEKLKGNQDAQLLATEWYINAKSDLTELQLDAQIDYLNKSAEIEGKRIKENDKLKKEEFEKLRDSFEKELELKKRYADLFFAIDESKAYNKSLQSSPTSTKNTWGMFGDNMKDTLLGNPLEDSKLQSEIEYNNSLLTIQQERFNKQKEMWEEEMNHITTSAERKLLIEQEINAATIELDNIATETQIKNAELVKKAQQDKVNRIEQATSASLSVVSDVFSTVSELSDEGSKQAKGFAIAAAVMDTLSSAVAAYKSMVGIPYVGPVLAPIAAATALASGYAQVRKIQSTDEKTGNGGGDGGGYSPSATPNIAALSDSLPISYTRNIMGDAETEEMNQSQKVYILESDIQESNRRVEIREENSEF